MSDESGLDVVMLLCEAAQVSSGKLYILGGGWSQWLLPEQPITMSLAVKILIPWDRANHTFKISACLVTDDGDSVTDGDGNEIKADGQVQVGRPPGLKHGEALDAPFVLNFSGVTLEPGGYVWQLWVGRTLEAQAKFRVRFPPGTTPAG